MEDVLQLTSTCHKQNCRLQTIVKVLVCKLTGKNIISQKNILH